jgi:hypothetical protein
MLGFKEVSHEVITLELANKLAAVPLFVCFPTSATPLHMGDAPAVDEAGQSLNLYQLFQQWGQQPDLRLVWAQNALRFTDTIGLQDQEIIGLRREGATYVLLADQSSEWRQSRKVG